MTGPDVRDDPDRTARAITGKSDLAVSSPDARLRQGVVTAVDVPNARVDVALGGDTTTTIPSVAHLSNYRPTVNDPCWVLVKGPDLLVLDRLGPFGPSVISSAATAFVPAYETRSGNTYGDLATPGPAVTVSVSPSGRLLVQTSAWTWADTVDDTAYGGSMGFALSGANTRPPGNGEVNYLFYDNGAQLINLMAASSVTLVTGLNAGTTTVTAKYSSPTSDGDSGAWENRHLWALPL